MGRFVRVGGSDMLILWAAQSARVSVQVLKSASSSSDSDRTSCVVVGLLIAIAARIVHFGVKA